jgi:hypothetical protein
MSGKTIYPTVMKLIAESYLKKGGKQMAIIYYKKALEKNETNKNAKG